MLLPAATLGVTSANTYSTSGSQWDLKTEHGRVCTHVCHMEMMQKKLTCKPRQYI